MKPKLWILLLLFSGVAHADVVRECHWEYDYYGEPTRICTNRWVPNYRPLYQPRYEWSNENRYEWSNENRYEGREERHEHHRYEYGHGHGHRHEWEHRWQEW